MFNADVQDLHHDIALCKAAAWRHQQVVLCRSAAQLEADCLPVRAHEWQYLMRVVWVMAAAGGRQDHHGRAICGAADNMTATWAPLSVLCQRAADPDTICLTVQAQECKSLMRLVRALIASCSKLVAGKSIMVEGFAELQ